jgi:hypothetical protein
MRRVLRVAVVGVAVALPLAALVGWLVDGTAGLVGALVGVLIPVLFFGITVATAVLTTRLSPGAMGAVVLGSWALKLVGLIAALVVLDGADGWSRPVFMGAFALTVPAWLALEAWTVITTRQAYTAPVASGGSRSERDDAVGSLRGSHDGHT